MRCRVIICAAVFFAVAQTYAMENQPTTHLALEQYFTRAKEKQRAEHDALYAACKRKDFCKAHGLIKAGVPIHAKDRAGNSVFHAMLTKKNDDDLVKFKHAEVDGILHICNFIRFAARTLPSESNLINDLNAQGLAPLHVAIRKGVSQNIFIALLCCGADPYVPGKNGKTPMRLAEEIEGLYRPRTCAAYRKNPGDVARWFVELMQQSIFYKDLECSIKYNEPDGMALKAQQAKDLVQHWSDAHGRTLMHCIAQYGNVRSIEVLAPYVMGAIGKPVTDVDGKTPLMLAQEAGNTEVAKYICGLELQQMN
jgi:hypothetical protein